MTKKQFPRTSIAEVIEKVKHRLSPLCATDQLDQLIEHVKKAASAAVDLVLKSPCLCGAVPPRRKGNSKPQKRDHSPKITHQVIAKAHALTPTFFDSTRRATLPQRSRSDKQWTRRVGERMDLAEVILICCSAMRYPAKKPTASLWALVEMCWHRWDELETQEELIRRKRSDHCRLGGIKRHAEHAALKEKAIPLLTSAAPPQGWMSKAHAGDVVGELLIQIAVESGYEGSLELDQWSRTIQQLIRKNPFAAEAFNGKSRKRRCHRVCGTRAQRPCRVRRKVDEGRDGPDAEVCT